MTSVLAELAGRIEQAAEPSEELFWHAFRICFPKPERIWESEDREEWTTEYENWQSRQWAFSTFLEAKAWLDAAASMVPEGWDWQVDNDGDAYVSTGDESHHVVGATPALALTAACLKARASLLTSKSS